MKEYKIRSKNFLTFELTENEVLIGTLTYKNWFKFSAELEILDSKYQIEPKGFWGTTIELKEGEKILLKFRMNWNGEIVIQTYFNEIKKWIYF